MRLLSKVSNEREFLYPQALADLVSVIVGVYLLNCGLFTNKRLRTLFDFVGSILRVESNINNPHFAGFC